MGVRYVPHSDLCGCNRCAVQAERDSPQQVFDAIEDKSVLSCGCEAWRGCDCDDYDWASDADMGAR